MEYKLSVVFTARNDNYGGNLINRIESSIKTLDFLVSKYNLLTELIIVDYNPPSDRKKLCEEINIRTSGSLKLRFIIVPKEFHLKKYEGNKIPLLEYIAKNIGIRRASGEWILVGNPDIIFSEKMIKYLSEQNLNKESFYRVHRSDILINYFDPSKKPEDILDMCKKSVKKILVNNTVVYSSFYYWFKDVIKTKNLGVILRNPLYYYLFYKTPKDIHEYAAGDFLLTHRENWKKVHGYDETPLSSFMDSYILHEFIILGLEQEILPYPIFHIDHEVGKAGRPEVSIKKYEDDVKNMSETKKSYRQPNDNWGSPEEKFKETVV